MSDQGPLPDRRDDFGLIETLLWTPEGGFELLPEHLARLAASSAELGFACDLAKVEAALSSAIPNAAASPLPQSGGGSGRGFLNGDSAGAESPPPHPSPAKGRPPGRPSEDGLWRESEPRLRVRLVLSRDGALEVTSTPIDPVPAETIWRVVLAQTRFDSGARMLRHKTTRRALYEDALARAMREDGADEVLFMNERDELCESARCNLFVPQGDRLLTPPLSSGLLPGTLRARLLAQGRASEAVLRLADLPETFWLGNSVRGLVRARRAV
jgi:branched-subunit amino acid aminotransferase/4-amino-4-deoxychorismate lyase